MTEHDDALLVVDPWPIGHAVDRYTLQRKLGSGAMGVVFAAHDSQLHREVALKLLRPDASRDPERLALRLLREARAVARVRHPNVVTVHDAGRDGRDLFIAMELLQGQTLREWQTGSSRTEAEVMAVLVPAARGLAAAHEAGLVHRDFKPANVFVEPGGRVCVLDFGLARSLDEIDPEDEPTDDRLNLDARAVDRLATLTRTGALVGTPAYMSPEQLRRQLLDARSDQFAFCVAAYEALVGHRPFAGGTAAAVLVNMLDGTLRPPPPGVTVSAAVLAVLRRGLHEQPDQRFPSMGALIEALEQTHARPASWRRWIGLGVLGAAAAATLAVAWPGRDAGPRLAAHGGAPDPSSNPREGATTDVVDSSARDDTDDGHDSEGSGSGSASPPPVASRGRTKMFVFRGPEYLRFDQALDRTDPGYPRSLSDGRFEKIWPQGPDAAFVLDGGVWLTRGTALLHYVFEGDEPVLQAEPPQRLGEGRWAAVQVPRLDAAFVRDGRAYLFEGDRYWRLDGPQLVLAPQYPRAIDEDAWPGLWSGDIDAAVRSTRGAYLFRGAEYTRYDLQLVEADPGYPKVISDGLWPGMGGRWPRDIDAAFLIRLDVGAPVSSRTRP
ncbi:MAG: protein kinase [Deltaproteobacteria bacterium]|nr:protein kinase [Deltaproteobacteria bacterium]